MLTVLAAFAAMAIVVPGLARRLGTKVFPVAALVPAAAFVLTLTQGPEVVAGRAVTESAPWIPSLDITLGLRVDGLAWVLALVVTGVGTLVLLYCTRYFADSEDGLGRFAGVLTAFAGAMYGLVVADDVYLLFTMWELTTLFSYLLIGHYHNRAASRGAALEALLVTTFGGLTMLVGIVVLSVQSGSTSLAAIVAHPPTESTTWIAVVLVLVGAFSKSALVPFHFWLPAAMAAPTPVSAYLHAAAMVKAGVYLVGRLAPGFADLPVWQPLVIGFGLATMIIGGYRALKQSDLKLVLAYGTVGQLGFLTLVAGYGTRNAALAAAALLVGHALFKSTLFLVTGVVDKRAGTRDLRQLSGLGRRMPVIAVAAVVAAASMAGLPPMFGFVAKESVLTALLEDAEAGSPFGAVALVGVAIGSVLTVAYSARFVWGAFWRKPGVVDTELHPVAQSIAFAPVVLAATTLVLGLGAQAVDPLVQPVTRGLPATSAVASAALAPSAAHLALWHGLEPALGISAATLVLGLGLFVLRSPIAQLRQFVPVRLEAGRVYWSSVGDVDRVAARVTGLLQRGSVPFYLAVILGVMVASVGALLAVNRAWPDGIRLADSPGQVMVAALMAIASIAAARAGKRYQAVVLVGVTGYGMAALFAFQGAPDLALTQALVETITLVAFVLVLRRLPMRLGAEHASPRRWWRVLLGCLVGATMAVVAVVALGARQALPISRAFPRLAVEQGHGDNVVNVTLVDIRGWDTMGELAVLIVAATGVASLVFLTSRSQSLPAPHATVRRTLFRTRFSRSPQRAVPVDRGTRSERFQVEPADAGHRSPWLLAGRTLSAENRSILLEAVVRIAYHSLIVVSLWLLFVGHNEPGGGFAGGLVAGLALTGRYLAGGRFELAAALPVDAGKLLGAGLVLAVGSAAVPLLFGADALTSTWFDQEIPVIGHVVFVTSTFFDIGVYLIVIALVLDVLRSLGAEIDRQEELADPDAADEDDETGRVDEPITGAVPTASVATSAGGRTDS